MITHAAHLFLKTILQKHGCEKDYQTHRWTEGNILDSIKSCHHQNSMYVVLCTNARLKGVNHDSIYM